MGENKINTKMSTFDWNAFSSEIASGTPPATLLQRIADSGAFVPVGELARYVLTEWANLDVPLRGGLAKFEGGYGFRLNGESDEPLLTLVLRDGENAKSVLSDLRENDQPAFGRVLSKIRKIVSQAELLLGRVGSGGSPPQAKAMMSALHKRIVSLGGCVDAQLFEAPSDAYAEALKTAPASEPEDTPNFQALKDLLTGREEWTAREVVEGIGQLHLAAAKERLLSGRIGRFGKLERTVFGDPKPYFRRKRGMGLGFAATALYGPVHDLFKIAGLHRDYQLESRVWDELNWKSLLERCDGADVVELEERDLAPCSTDVSYWISIGDPAEFVRELRETILQIGYPGQPSDQMKWDAE